MDSYSLSITAPRTELEDLEREKEDLTREERDCYLADIYGTPHPIQETPDLASLKLEEMELELQKLMFESSQSTNVLTPRIQDYQTALEKLPDFVKSGEFRLQFLRSEYFNAKSAAQKMLQYWTLKVKLFGEDVAYRERIRLEDLSENDQATLQNNGLWLSPDKDASNRSLIFSTRQKWVFSKKENIARLIWYVLQVTAEDPLAQQNGAIALLADDGDFSLVHHYNRKLDRLVTNVMESFPLRIVALHHFFTDTRIRLILPFLLFTLGKRYKARYQYYYERSTSRAKNSPCRRQRLQSFGINMDVFPIPMGGKSNANAMTWREERRKRER